MQHTNRLTASQAPLAAGRRCLQVYISRHLTNTGEEQRQADVQFPQAGLVLPA